MFWENYLLLCSSVGKAPNAVASEIGIKSSGTVTGWSNGAIPRKSVLFKLCQYFGVTEEQLLSDRLLMDPVPPEQSTRGMTPEEREAYYRGQHLDEKKEKPAEIGELSKDEIEYIKWLREAPDNVKEAVKLILKGKN